MCLEKMHFSPVSKPPHMAAGMSAQCVCVCVTTDNEKNKQSDNLDLLLSVVQGQTFFLVSSFCQFVLTQ